MGGVAALPVERLNLGFVNATATLNGQELELFRVGDYGAKGRYTREDLQGLVSSYAASGEAAVTIGHPQSDSEPAFGWIKSVRLDGDVLKGTPGEVVPHIDSLVKAGAYKHRSIGLSRGAGGRLQLRHVALLGAVPPAVQGLAPARFSSDPYQEFALEGDGMADEQQLDQRIEAGFTKFFSNLFGKKTEPTQVDVEAAITRAKAEFSAEIATERTARLAAEQQFADHKKATEGTAAQARAHQVVAELKTKGVWIPAYDVAGVPAIFSALASQPQTIKFSDRDGKEVESDLMQAFSDVLVKVGKIVPSGHLFSAQAITPQSGAVPNANGAEVDAASVTFSSMVTARATEQKIPYTEAYKQLVSEGKKPEPGSAAAGAV